MAIIQFPGTDFHDLNLDWVLQQVKNLLTEWASTKEEWETLKGSNEAFVSFITSQWDDFKSYVENYLANLPLTEEVSAKIEAMVEDGTLLELITHDDGEGSALSDVAAQWLAAHITQETGYVIDDTLTVQGAAADAKATGDEISDLKSAVENNSNLLFESYVINPNNIFNGWKLDSSVVTPVSEATIIQGEPTNTLYLANTDTPSGKTNCIIDLGNAIASGNSGDKYYLHVSLKVNRNVAFASKPTVLYFDGFVGSTQKERFYITFYTPSANDDENYFVDYVYEYTRGSQPIDRYELWFPIGFDIYIKNMYITKTIDSSPFYRQFEQSIVSLYSGIPVKITNWGSGWIRANGTIGKADENCITPYLNFYSGIVTIDVKSGYKIRIAQYSNTEGTFDNFPVGTASTGTVQFNADMNKWYRIELANSADSDILPESIPNDCVVYYQTTPTDATLSRKWRPADAYATGNAIQNLSYTDPLKYLLEKGIFIGDSTTYGANWYENNHYDESDPTTSQMRNNYPHVFSEMTNCEATNAGRSGSGAKIWWNEQNNLYNFAEYDFAIICLGTNYGLTDTLDADTSAASYEGYANTNTGCYCKIVEKILSQNPYIHLFLAYPQCRNGLVEDGETADQTSLPITCSVIDQIAEKYGGLHVLDDRANYKVSEYQSSDNVHFTRIGNVERAKTYLTQIVNYIRNNPWKFKVEY